MEVDVLFLIVLFTIAIMYASVGHSGASGYLALMAFISARISIDTQVYKIIFGIFLVIAVASMIYKPKKQGNEIIPFNFFIAAFIGMVLGFLSGFLVLAVA